MWTRRRREPRGPSQRCGAGRPRTLQLPPKPRLQSPPPLDPSRGAPRSSWRLWGRPRLGRPVARASVECSEGQDVLGSLPARYSAPLAGASSLRRACTGHLPVCLRLLSHNACTSWTAIAQAKACGHRAGVMPAFRVGLCHPPLNQDSQPGSQSWPSSLLRSVPGGRCGAACLWGPGPPGDGGGAGRLSASLSVFSLSASHVFF